MPNPGTVTLIAKLGQQNDGAFMLVDASDIDWATAGTVTIASDAITQPASSWQIPLDTQAAAATDDLATITKAAKGPDFIVVRPVDDARTIVIKHNTGNIRCVGNADITLDDAHDCAMLFWDATNSRWMAFFGGGGVSGGGSGSVNATMVRKTADESVTSSTTLQNDDALLFAIAANENWAFECVLFVHQQDSSAADIKLGFTVPTGATVKYGASAGPSVNISANVGDGNWAVGDTSAEELSFGAESNALTVIVLRGVVFNGSTAGNVQLQWAQNSSVASPLTVKAGSHLIASNFAATAASGGDAGALAFAYGGF